MSAKSAERPAGVVILRIASAQSAAGKSPAVPGETRFGRGFNHKRRPGRKAWQEHDYATIIVAARKLPENVLQEDPKLLMWYDQAVTRSGED